MENKLFDTLLKVDTWLDANPVISSGGGGGLIIFPPPEYITDNDLLIVDSSHLVDRFCEGYYSVVGNLVSFSLYIGITKDNTGNSVSFKLPYAMLLTQSVPIPALNLDDDNMIVFKSQTDSFIIYDLPANGTYQYSVGFTYPFSGDLLWV